MRTGDRHVHIVDDDGAVRRSTAILLRINGLSVEQWASGKEFLDAVGTVRAGCILLDLRMPEMDGIDVLDQLASRGVAMPVVVLTGHGDIRAAIRAMKAGATDFLEKPVEKAALIAAIDAALDRLAGLQGQAVSAAQARMALAVLTPREREVLIGLTQGLPNKGIAQRLGISPRTVEIHRANALERLGAQNLSQALRIAFVAGLGDDEPPVN